MTDQQRAYYIDFINSEIEKITFDSIEETQQFLRAIAGYDNPIEELDTLADLKEIYNNEYSHANEEDLAEFQLIFRQRFAEFIKSLSEPDKFILTQMQQLASKAQAKLASDALPRSDVDLTKEQILTIQELGQDESTQISYKTKGPEADICIACARLIYKFAEFRTNPHYRTRNIIGMSVTRKIRPTYLYKEFNQIVIDLMTYDFADTIPEEFSKEEIGFIEKSLYNILRLFNASRYTVEQFKSLPLQQQSILIYTSKDLDNAISTFDTETLDVYLELLYSQEYEAIYKLKQSDEELQSIFEYLAERFGLDDVDLALARSTEITDFTLFATEIFESVLLKCNLSVENIRECGLYKIQHLIQYIDDNYSLGTFLCNTFNLPLKDVAKGLSIEHLTIMLKHFQLSYSITLYVHYYGLNFEQICATTPSEFESMYFNYARILQVKNRSAKPKSSQALENTLLQYNTTLVNYAKEATQTGGFFNIDEIYQNLYRMLADLRTLGVNYRIYSTLRNNVSVLIHNFHIEFKNYATKSSYIHKPLLSSEAAMFATCFTVNELKLINSLLAQQLSIFTDILKMQTKCRPNERLPDLYSTLLKIKDYTNRNYDPAAILDLANSTLTPQINDAFRSATNEKMSMWQWKLLHDLTNSTACEYIDLNGLHSLVEPDLQSNFARRHFILTQSSEYESAPFTFVSDADHAGLQEYFSNNRTSANDPHFAVQVNRKQCSLLVYAYHYGNAEILQTIKREILHLSQSIVLHKLKHNGNDAQNLLNAAVKGGDLDIVEALLIMGYSAHVPDACSKSAIDHALASTGGFAEVILNDLLTLGAGQLKITSTAHKRSKMRI